MSVPVMITAKRMVFSAFRKLVLMRRRRWKAAGECRGKSLYDSYKRAFWKTDRIPDHAARSALYTTTENFSFFFFISFVRWLQTSKAAAAFCNDNYNNTPARTTVVCVAVAPRSSIVRNKWRVIASDSSARVFGTYTFREITENSFTLYAVWYITYIIKICTATPRSWKCNIRMVLYYEYTYCIL